MNIFRVVLISIAVVSILMVIFTFLYEELVTNKKYDNKIDDFMKSKEGLKKSKRQIVPFKDSISKSSINNYEILLEQIYTERSLCVESNNKKITDESSHIDKNTCERYCENRQCEEEHLKTCGDGNWINYKNSCYKVFNKKLNWQQSQTKCQEYDANLVVINDETIQNFITNWLINTQQLDEKFFIGLKRKINKNLFYSYLPDSKANWEWINGEKLLYTNWNVDEPNNDGNIEDCVELILPRRQREQGKWNDIRCDEIERNFICEKKANLSAVRDKDEVVYEFMRFREINELNVVEFINLLNEITSKNSSTFTAQQISNVVNVLVKIASLPYFPVTGTRGFFSIVNNLLYAPDEIFKQLKNVSNTILNTIDIITTKIRMMQKSHVIDEVRVQVQNIAASINDLSLDVRGRNEDLSKIFETSDDETATITVKTDFITKNRNTPASPIEFNKTDIEYNTNENQTFIGNSNRYRISIVYFKNKKLFQKVPYTCSDENQSKERLNACKMYNSEVGGSIVSVNVNTFNTSTLEKESDVVDYDIKYTKVLNNTNHTLWCGYWVFKDDDDNNGGGFWSNKGCEYINYNSDTGSHKCRCNHTTHYALLFSPQSTDIKISDTETVILSTVTYIGLALSIVGLLATLITYAFFNTLRHGIIHKSLIILATCLLISNYLFLQVSFLKPTINRKFCLATAVFLHYSILVTFMWQLTIAIAQYLTFVKVINNHINKFMLKASLMSFGLPIIMPLTIVILDVEHYLNRSQSFCWLHGATLYASFAAPIIIISIINLGFFISILCSIFNRPSQFKTNTSVRRNQIGASLCCFVLLGSTWLFGLTLFFNYNHRIISEVLFCILNTTQGFFIFLFHVLLSKTKRELWNQLINKNSTLNSNHKKMSSTKSITSNNTDPSNNSTNPKIAPFHQSIKFNFENINATNLTSNKIILNNNNNIILNDNPIKETIKESVNNNNNNDTDNIKKRSSMKVSTIQEPIYLNPSIQQQQQQQQYHHIHHHIHHHKNKRKRQRIAESTVDNNIRGVTRGSKINKGFIPDEIKKADFKIDSLSKRRQYTNLAHLYNSY